MNELRNYEKSVYFVLIWCPSRTLTIKRVRKSWREKKKRILRIFESAGQQFYVGLFLFFSTMHMHLFYLICIVIFTVRLFKLHLIAAVLCKLSGLHFHRYSYSNQLNIAVFCRIIKPCAQYFQFTQLCIIYCQWQLQTMHVMWFFMLYKCKTSKVWI